MVLSNYEIHAIQIDFQVFLESNSKYILRIEYNSINSTIRNRSLLQSIHFRNVLLQAEAFYSLTRPPETTFHMKEILQDSSILHYKGSLSRKLFYIQKAKRSSIDSTYRRQRDFQSNHPAVHIHVCYKAFQRHYRTFKTFIHSKAILHASRTSKVPPHYSILQPECIFYTSVGFHIKLHQVPVERLQTF